jgi:hypothetical protein
VRSGERGRRGVASERRADHRATGPDGRAEETSRAPPSCSSPLST